MSQSRRVFKIQKKIPQSILEMADAEGRPRRAGAQTAGKHTAWGRQDRSSGDIVLWNSDRFSKCPTWEPTEVWNLFWRRL